MDNIHSKSDNLKHIEQAENAEMHSVYSTIPSLSPHFKISMASTFDAESCNFASVTVLLTEEKSQTMWVNRPLEISQLGQLSLSSFRGR